MSNPLKCKRAILTRRILQALSARVVSKIFDPSTSSPVFKEDKTFLHSNSFSHCALSSSYQTSSSMKRNLRAMQICGRPHGNQRAVDFLTAVRSPTPTYALPCSKNAWTSVHHPFTPLKKMHCKKTSRKNL